MRIKLGKINKAAFIKSVWAFPSSLLIVFLILTALGINGSSVGMYERLLNGSSAKNSDIIFGQPKPVRSDEYLVFTPRVALQAQSDYPAFNEKMGSGREVVMTAEAPMKDWVGFFRPHTWGFFVLPFANAFAFSWWFGLFALIISSYFFVLRVLNNQKLLAILLSLSFSLSPFILWWYQVRLLLPLAYFFMAAILLMRILNRERIGRIRSQNISDLLHVAGLAYIGSSFGLLLYAPFLIPIAIVLLILVTGYVIDGFKTGKYSFAKIKRPLLLIGAGLLIVLVVGLGFYFDRREMIEAIANSAYPGDRQVDSGDLPFSPLYRLFDSFLMPLLQQPPAGKFYTNQSEASNFILLLPFLLLPGLLLQAYDYIKNRRIDWTLLLIHATAILFISRIALPFADGFFDSLLLDRVPNNRLLVGVGLLGFLQLIYLIRYMAIVKVPKRLWQSLASMFSVLVFAWLLIFARYFFSDYLMIDKELLVYLLVWFLALSFTAIIASFLMKKHILASFILLVFTALSGFYIMPLQKGLAFFEDSKIINRIKEVSAPNESWAVVNNFPFENLPIVTGRRLVNGHQPYTDFGFWRQLDKSKTFEHVYNRQAHVLFVTEDAKPDKFLPEPFANINKSVQLVKGNVFKVRFECSQFFYEQVNFVLTTQKIDMDCLKYVDSVVYPEATFYIYKLEG